MAARGFEHSVALHGESDDCGSKGHWLTTAKQPGLSEYSAELKPAQYEATNAVQLGPCVAQLGAAHGEPAPAVNGQ